MEHTNEFSRAPSVIAMLVLALGGSLFYGASLSQAVEADALGGALWLTLCAGLGWAALVPALTLASRLRLSEVLRHCLVTICYGEAVLVIGAIANFADLSNGTAANLLIVFCSNVLMAAVLATRLVGRTFAVWKTLSLWVFVLDGVGCLAFWTLSFLLQGVAK
jgi:hypothetical protein